MTIGLTWQKYIPASLKGMMEEDILAKIESCKVKDCIICEYDKGRDFENYKIYQKKTPKHFLSKS